jgi:hypothetical protein
MEDDKMMRGLKDGLVKATIDGLNTPFEQFYLDSWVIYQYFNWKLKERPEPETISYIRQVRVRKIISDLVKIEINNKIKEDFEINITDAMWETCLTYLNLYCIGNPLNLSPTNPNEFDEAHLATATSLNKCIIITGDQALIEKNPSIVWDYGEVRKVHSNT